MHNIHRQMAKIKAQYRQIFVFWRRIPLSGNTAEQEQMNRLVYQAVPTGQVYDEFNIRSIVKQIGQYSV